MKVKDFLRDHPLGVAFAIFNVLSIVGIQLWEHCAPSSIHFHKQAEIDRIKVKIRDRFSLGVPGDRAGNGSAFECLLHGIDSF